MYPSLVKSKVKNIMFNIIRMSDFNIQELNWKTMSILIKNDIEEDRINRLGLRNLIPTPKTNKQKGDDDEEHYDCYFESPTDRQIRIMTALVSDIVIEFFMSNHSYEVGDTIYLQNGGAPIGLDISRVMWEDSL